MALALFLLLRFLTNRETEAGNVITHMLLIHNLFPQWLGSINGAWWTLALEGQFYLIFPLMVAGFRQWGVRRMLFATLALSLAWRTWAWHAHDLSLLSTAYYWCYALPARLFEFTLGMTAALVLARHSHMLTGAWLRTYACGVVGFAATSVYVVNRWTRFGPVADILWGLTFFCVVMYAATRNAQGAPIFTWRPLAWTGAISYSIYLLHDPLIQQSAIIVRPLGWPPHVTWIVFEGIAVPLSIAIGWLFYRLVESRFVGRCPEFRWPAALRTCILGLRAVLSRRKARATLPVEAN